MRYVRLRLSLDLEFNNLSGGEIQEKVRIFAKGRGAVSKQVTIDLPSLPILITVARCPVYSPEEAIAKLFAGHELQITGVAFLPRQTLWIGSTRLPVESVDNTNITFSLPESLPEGQYALSITNERGRSTVVTVQVVK
jgi:IPT/TIG domain-containing protein